MEDTYRKYNGHYKKIGIEPFEIIQRAKLDYWEGNAIKYLLRYKYKNGKKDLIKARVYLDYLITNYGRR